MSSKRYPEELRIEAVKQVTERGHPMAEIRRLKAELKGVTEERPSARRLRWMMAVHPSGYYAWRA